MKVHWIERNGKQNKTIDSISVAMDGIHRYISIFPWWSWMDPWEGPVNLLDSRYGITGCLSGMWRRNSLCTWKPTEELFSRVNTVQWSHVALSLLEVYSHCLLVGRWYDGRAWSTRNSCIVWVVTQRRVCLPEPSKLLQFKSPLNRWKLLTSWITSHENFSRSFN